MQNHSGSPNEISETALRCMDSLIYIVIPVHNRKSFTRECLWSLERQTLADHYRIIVVDAGSNDGTREMLAREFPDVIVLYASTDLFWTGTINLGIKYALDHGANFVLTLNNDTVLSETFLEQMSSWANRTPDALLGALEVNIESSRPHYGGEWVDWKWSKSRFLLDELEEKDQKGLHEVALYPGRGLLIPRKVFREIGFFEEEKLPHYLADYDFTQQARRSGFKVYCNYDAKLYSYPEESGDHALRRRKSFKNYFKHLFGIRGGGNLRNFTIYTVRNCPRKYLLPALVTGYMRRILGYWLK